MSNDGDAPLPPLSPGPDPTRHPPDPSIAVDPQEQAWQRLIARAVPHDELPSLIETIFSERKSNTVDRLSGSDAQAFIDVTDEVRHRAHYFRRMFDLLLFLLLCSGIEENTLVAKYMPHIETQVGVSIFFNSEWMSGS